MICFLGIFAFEVDTIDSSRWLEVVQRRPTLSRHKNELMGREFTMSISKCVFDSYTVKL